MTINIELFPNRDFYNLLKKIILQKNINSISDLDDELKKYKTIVEYKNYYLEIEKLHEIDNLSVVKSQPILFNMLDLDNDLNKIIHQFDMCIIDNDTLLPLIYIDKDVEYNNDVNHFCHYLSKPLDNMEFLDNKDIIQIYKNYIGEYVTLFYHKDNWYVTNKRNVYSINGKETFPTLFKNMITDKMTNWNTELDKDYSYHFTFIHYRLDSCISSHTWNKEFKDLIYLKKEKKLTLLTLENSLHTNNFTQKQKIYISCKDELLTQLEIINSDMISMGKLQYRGLVLHYNDNYNRFNINFDIELYHRINSKLTNFDNINQAYLSMYKNDECNSLLPYITNNSIDIIRRVNTSIKTVSKEILDIYFLTRNQNNVELYGKLSTIYKNTLYNMHNIYISKRFNETDGKTAVTIDNIYAYLKKSITSKDLISIYRDRKDLIDELNKIEKYKTVLNTKCINTLMQTALMFD